MAGVSRSVKRVQAHTPFRHCSPVSKSQMATVGNHFNTYVSSIDESKSNSVEITGKCIYFGNMGLSKRTLKTSGLGPNLSKSRTDR